MGSENGAGETCTSDTGKALAMLNAFASVTATAFDVTHTDIDGTKTSYQPKRSLEELRRSISALLAAATTRRHNLIIRPRSTGAKLVQLDDLDDTKAATIAPHTFMVIRTSPGNHQAWLALTDAPADKDAAKDLARRLRKGTGADPTATGATRIAGSLNFKPAYAPAFPLVEIVTTNAGTVTSFAALDAAGFLAPEQAIPPASAPRSNPPLRTGPERRWPDYQQALHGAPFKRDGSGPDRSRADFMFCKWAAQRGWSVEDIAAKLAEVSPKAQERIRSREDPNYPLLTARNAARAVECEREQRRSFKSTLSPRQ